MLIPISGESVPPIFFFIFYRPALSFLQFSIYTKFYIYVKVYNQSYNQLDFYS